MQPNPVLRRLGFSDHDRLAIIHTDDIGMCHSSVLAFADLYAFGLISSGAVMVPCPWALKAAEFAREHPEVDLGVHLTLTSEWKTYRWGPISTREPASGLIDEEGYFYRTTRLAQEHGDPTAVECEITAQIERALAMGLKPTHADTHMGTVACTQFMGGYLKQAILYRLPPMIFRMDEAGWQANGLTPEAAVMAARMVAQMEEVGLPLLDHLVGLPLDKPDNRLELAKATFAALQPGITHFIIHPSVDTPELRAITPDWRSRVGDYETFMREDLRAYLRDIGVQVIGYRTLQTLMPDPASLAAWMA